MEAELPETIYVNGKEHHLVTKNSVVEGPVVYAKAKFKELTITDVPKMGVYEVQVVTFPQPDKTMIYFAVRDNELNLFSQPVESNGLILYKSAEMVIFPLGFYERYGNVFLRLQELPLLSGLTSAKESFACAEPIGKEQKYYVLENDYEQLVFSNIGGALVEINLPFESDTDKKSVVKEIGFDRDILKDSPENARFPAHPYFAYNQKEAQKGKEGGYYPLLRRGLLGKNECPFRLNTMQRTSFLNILRWRNLPIL